MVGDDIYLLVDSMTQMRDPGTEHNTVWYLRFCAYASEKTRISFDIMPVEAARLRHADVHRRWLS